MTADAVPSFAVERQGAPSEPALVEGTKEWAEHVPATQVDKKDADTPDAWVPRDERILRLTGRHPLNCEAPMDALMAAGFITPPSIHYVRNHGAVPKTDWASHRVTINGLVERELTLSMDELLALPLEHVTLPITLVCAGNRRKEENMIKKSIGFNWGPCAASTNYWTGIRLGDLLRHVGVKEGANANHVSFRGPKGELPKGDDGSYGTSLLLYYALDNANDVLVAFKQNGRWLTPDHGFPVRMIIPGFIGGRMVKWLEEITVTEQESQNFYHFHDNRVLPPHVDEELAKKEGWWFKPDFIINELNINSAVARPWHDEVVPLATNKPYEVNGYAYTGGGRKIIRVEVSTNDGASWRQAEIIRHEQPTKAGRLWCWVFWKLEVATFDFTQCKELLVRAWDSSQNGQPATITWNLMGMMNNCYYRIKVFHHVDGKGNMALRFQHPAPVEPGEMGAVGWREEEKLAREGAEAAPPPAAAVVVSDKARLIAMSEVEQHATEESAWFVHEGKVYDATPFLEEHPGGAESILISAGMDATDEFNSIHSKAAKRLLADYYIGDLAPEEASSSGAGDSSASLSSLSSGSSSATVEAAVAVSSSGGGKDKDADAAAAAANGNGISVAAAAAAVQANGTSDLGISTPAIPDEHGHAAVVDAAPAALDPRKKIAFALAEKHELSHNVRRFRFALPSPQHKFGLPCGKHVFLYADVGGETVMRAYTPTSSDDDLGYFDLVIKVYRANEHPRFPEGGKMSQHLDTLKVGDTIQVKGPVGHFVYEGAGRFSNNRKPGTMKGMSFMAGGTGITPCWSVIMKVLKDANDTTELRLLYANQTPDDILLKDELDALAAKHPNFKVHYTVDRLPEGMAPADWPYSMGLITEDMCRVHLLPAAEGHLAGMCGPPPMIKFAGIPNLTKMGYTEQDMVQF